MAAKLSDVAKKSRLLCNYRFAGNQQPWLFKSKKTKDKVFAAMRELNYRPNSIARSLQGKKMKLVGLIFPEITNPFFSQN